MNYMEKVGAANFGTKQEAYSYLENLPEGFNGRAYCAESGKWMVSWRFVPNYSITSELDADEYDAEFRAQERNRAMKCDKHDTPLNGDGLCFWCEVETGNIPAPLGPNAPKFNLSREWYERQAVAEENYIVEQQHDCDSICELIPKMQPAIPESLSSLHDNWCEFPKCLGACNCHLVVPDSPKGEER